MTQDVLFWAQVSAGKTTYVYEVGAVRVALHH